MLCGMSGYEDDETPISFCPFCGFPLLGLDADERVAVDAVEQFLKRYSLAADIDKRRAINEKLEREAREKLQASLDVDSRMRALGLFVPGDLFTRR